MRTQERRHTPPCCLPPITGICTLEPAAELATWMVMFGKLAWQTVQQEQVYTQSYHTLPKPLPFGFPPLGDLGDIPALGDCKKQIETTQRSTTTLQRHSTWPLGDLPPFGV